MRGKAAQTPRVRQYSCSATGAKVAHVPSKHKIWVQFPGGAAITLAHVQGHISTNSVSTQLLISLVKTCTQCWWQRTSPRSFLCFWALPSLPRRTSCLPLLAPPLSPLLLTFVVKMLDVNITPPPPIYTLTLRSTAGCPVGSPLLLRGPIPLRCLPRGA